MAGETEPNIFDGSVLDNVIVEYAGRCGFAAVFLDKSSPLIIGCDVRKNAAIGISVDGVRDSPAIILDTEVRENANRGISIVNGSEHSVIGCTVNNNAGGIRITNATLNKVFSNSVFNNTVAENGAGILLNIAANSSVKDNVITNNFNILVCLNILL